MTARDFLLGLLIGWGCMALLAALTRTVDACTAE